MTLPMTLARLFLMATTPAQAAPNAPCFNKVYLFDAVDTPMTNPPPLNQGGPIVWDRTRYVVGSAQVFVWAECVTQPARRNAGVKNGAVVFQSLNNRIQVILASVPQDATGTVIFSDEDQVKKI